MTGRSGVLVDEGLELSGGEEGVAAEAPRERSVLRRGRHHLSREQVRSIQRERMLEAAVQVATNGGASSVTATSVVARAGVSRSAFYEAFADRDACLQAAFEQSVDRISVSAIAGYGSEGEWSERIRAGLTAMLDFLDAEPALARLCIVEVLAAGPKALRSRANVLEVLAEAVHQGRKEPGAPKALTPLIAEGIVGAVVAVLYTRLIASEPESLFELANPLMNLIVLPYLGPEAAREELLKPTPGPAERSATRRSTQMSGIQLDGKWRMTYRTKRVLRVVAECPGASNRQIAVAAEVRDEGQVSKLLNRLARRGLLYNTGHGRSKGAPNAWALTPHGAELERSIRY